MVNLFLPNNVDDLPEVEPIQPDLAPAIPEPALVDENEEPEEEEFEDEEEFEKEEPQEEEEDMEVALVHKVDLATPKKCDDIHIVTNDFSSVCD
ncbi:hypothetical protein Tco_0475054 [Tanacetum coccineum]